MGFQPAVAIVTTQTRLRGLLVRWGTRSSAKFRLNQAQAIQRLAVAGTSMELNEDDQVADDFDQYEQEDRAYNAAVQQLRYEVDLGLPIAVIKRQNIRRPGHVVIPEIELCHFPVTHKHNAQFL